MDQILTYHIPFKQTVEKNVHLHTFLISESF